MKYKRKSRRRFFLLMRSRTPSISSEFRGGGFEPPNHPLGTPLMMMMRRRTTTTTSIRPHHVAHKLITTGIVPSCPLDRNWLLCCHENFWRAIKDKTKWYPSNKEQPPSVTVLWQHCRGGLQAWWVWSVGLAATVAQTAKMNVSVATFSTTFQSSKARPLRCFETSGSQYR